MIGKLSVALLIVASPALAEEATQPGGAVNAEAEAPQPVAYKTKRVCRSIEVVGSSIPKTTCTTKKIPIKPVETESEDQAQAGGAAQPDSQN